ncbi:MAG: serine protease, partial [Bacteroidota bacterium]
MKKIHYVSLLYLLWFFSSEALFGQIQTNEIPISIQIEKSDPSFLKRSLLNSRLLPDLNNHTLIQEADQLASQCQNCRNYRYGKEIALNINFPHAAHKVKFRKGTIYRLELQSLSALGLQIGLSNFQLRKGEKIFIYNSDKTVIYGAFTDFNNSPNNKFLSRIVEGNRVTIEYFVPEQYVNPLNLLVSKVVHVFRSDIIRSNRVEGFDDSGSCTVNASCYNYSRESKAVVMWSGSGPEEDFHSFCTGALINTATNGPKPAYMLSAAHCWEPYAYRYNEDFIAYFDYESSTCENPGVSPINAARTIAGAHSRSVGHYSIFDVPTDYVLLELSTPPHFITDATYLGWDRSPEQNGTLINISHPSHDIKKIALSGSNAIRANKLVGCQPGTYTNTDIESFVINSWAVGVTQKGSSGSPLINSEGRLIGVLSGGSSRCADSPDADLCGDGSFLSGPDHFARFDFAWSNPNSKYNFPIQYLHSYLDPHGLNPTSIDLYDPTNPSSPGAGVLVGGSSFTPAMADCSLDRESGSNNSYRISLEQNEGYRLKFLDKEDNLIALNVNDDQVWFYKIQDCDISKSVEFEIPDRQILDFKMDGSHAVARVRNATNGFYSLIFYQIEGTTLTQVEEFFARDNTIDDYGVGLQLKNNMAVAVSRIEGGYGTLYIYQYKSGAWQLEERIQAPETELLDQGNRSFGRAVAFDGKNIFVGAPVVGGSSTKGKVFRYKKTQNPVGPDYWSEGIYTGANGNKDYGYKIASNGNQLIIAGEGQYGPVLHSYTINAYGAILSENNSSLTLSSSRFLSGDLYLSDNYFHCSVGRSNLDGVTQEVFRYKREQNSWVFERSLKYHDSQPGDIFGDGLYADEKNVVIGLNENGCGNWPGSVFVYDLYSIDHDEAITITSRYYTGTHVLNNSKVTFGGSTGPFNTYVTIPNGADVTLNSSHVVLKNGFRALKGGHFLADADNCSDFNNGGVSTLVLSKTSKQPAEVPGPTITSLP